MSNTIHYTNCPVCAGKNIHDVFLVKDYTVSGQEFMLTECKACLARFTQDVSDASAIGTYYESDDYISHTDTSKGLINRLYQMVRKRTIQQKRKLIGRITGLQQGTLLDVGSGTGVFAAEMKRNGWMVTGLEPDYAARQIAEKNNGIELKDINEFFHLQPGTFDVITLWHVLEHVHELQEYMVQLKKLLKPQGKLVIAVPNYTSADATVYGQFWAAYDAPRHLYHFSPSSVKMLAEKHGFKIIKHYPMWFDSFYVAMLSSRYKNGKTNLFSAFFNGLRSNLKAISDVKKCSSVIYVLSR